MKALLLLLITLLFMGGCKKEFHCQYPLNVADYPLSLDSNKLWITNNSSISVSITGYSLNLPNNPYYSTSSSNVAKMLLSHDSVFIVAIDTFLQRQIINCSVQYAAYCDRISSSNLVADQAESTLILTP